MPFAILSGVLLENGFFIIVSSGFNINARFTLNSINILIPQLVWGLLTGPFFIVLIKKIHEKIWKDRLSGESSGRNKK